MTSVKPEKDRQSRMHLYKNCLEISWLEKGNNFQLAVPIISVCVGYCIKIPNNFIKQGKTAT